MINESWSSDKADIKAEAHRFFGEKFKETHFNRPALISSHFKTISMMDAIRLEAPFTIEEVKDAV